MKPPQEDSPAAPGPPAGIDQAPLRDITWDGITKTETLTRAHAKLRHHLADSARNFDWPKVLAVLAEHPELANVTRLGGHSLYTPLHQAAHAGASLTVVSELLRRGAWRTARNAERLRPVDIARNKSHLHLQEILTPAHELDVPAEVLSAIQRHFHEVIHGRAAHLIREHGLRLPELEPMLEFRPRTFWFAVPGMYGGFAYRLSGDGRNARLTSDSWSRVCGGSGQRHEIDASGSRLIDEGFV